MQKQYVVRLADVERESLNILLKKNRVASQKMLRARVLLKSDSDGSGWTDAQIADAYGCRVKTVENIRERFVTDGFEITLEGKPKHRARSKVLNGDQEAAIIALRLGSPPKGFANWTLRLLAKQAVELAIVDSVSHETLRGTLKKTNSRTRRSSTGKSHQKPTPSSPQAWRKSLMSTPGPMIPGIQSCVWTSNRSNF